MNWTIILYHLMCVFLGWGVGLTVVVIVQHIFEDWAGYIQLDTGLSQEELKHEIKKIENTELVYEFERVLKLLLAVKRMVRWWKNMVILIVTGVFYFFLSSLYL